MSVPPLFSIMDATDTLLNKIEKGFCQERLTKTHFFSQEKFTKISETVITINSDILLLFLLPKTKMKQLFRELLLIGFSFVSKF
jgi:hypothetical protein